MVNCASLGCASVFSEDQYPDEAIPICQQVSRACFRLAHLKLSLGWDWSGRSVLRCHWWIEHTWPVLIHESHELHLKQTSEWGLCLQLVVGQVHWDIHLSSFHLFKVTTPPLIIKKDQNKQKEAAHFEKTVRFFQFFSSGLSRVRTEL